MLRQVLFTSIKNYSLLNPFKNRNRLNIIRLCNTNILGSINIENFLDKINTEYVALKKLDDNDKSRKKRLYLLSDIVHCNEKRKKIIKNLKSLADMESEKVDEMKHLIIDERKNFLLELEKLNRKIVDSILYIYAPDDYSALTLEVTAGVGGQEAMLFARELFDMYHNYIQNKGWDCDVIQLENTDLGGIRHASAVVTGNDAYSCLAHEAGVHRVQRIPATEKSGRVHTSTASVSVIPRPDDIDVTIKDKDLKIDTKRASGAGGQHVNTTDSAVRITHLPTGLVVEAQSERSQIKNREIAMKRLQNKLYQKHLDEQMSTKQATKKSQVGSSLRNEKIRTYNYNQDRITDHRIDGGTTHNLKAFFLGGKELDDLITKLKDKNKQKLILEFINNNNITK